MAKTAGEDCFEEYLSSVGLKWDYELSAGGRNADYLLHPVCTDVVCEVKDIEPGDMEERARKAGALVGIDSYPRIRRKIESSRRQLQPYKNKLPCVLVLFNSGARVPLSSARVAGAMFGDLGFAVRLRERDSVRATYLGRAKLRARQNTTFSAVAVVERIEPHAELFRTLVSKKMPQPSFKDKPRFNELQQAFREVRQEHPDLNFREVATRVRVIHNPYAALPLPVEVFAGSHDEHFQPNL